MPDTDQFVDTLQEWTELFMHQSMQKFIHYAKSSGLSMSQLGSLFHLNRAGSSDVSGMADHLGVTNAAASQMLERLVQQGLLSRSEDPHDRRVKQIVLTEKGSQILYEGIRARQSWITDLSAILTQDEKNQIIAAIDILNHKIRLLEQHVEAEN